MKCPECGEFIFKSEYYNLEDAMKTLAITVTNLDTRLRKQEVNTASFIGKMTGIAFAISVIAGFVGALVGTFVT